MTKLHFVLLLCLIAARTAPAMAEQSVDQKDKQFSQEAVTIKAGESITFSNRDTVSHDISIKSPDGSRLQTTMQKPGDTMSVEFDTPGDYRVMCLIHPKMKLPVTVTAK